jgi:hypothetical protein
VSLFGAIFAAGLAANLAAALPAGASLPTATAPDAIHALPSAMRALYLNAFTAALHPIFVYGAAIAVLAFALTWFLKEIPLRGAPSTPSRPASAGAYSERNKAAGGS